MHLQKPKQKRTKPQRFSPQHSNSTKSSTTLNQHSQQHHPTSPITITTHPFSSKQNKKNFWSKQKKSSSQSNGPKDLINLTNAPQLLGGLIAIYKPRGVTSTDLSNFMRLQVMKIHPALRFGFAGTLDENATGVFIGAVGTATQVLRYVLPHDKSYVARVKLGVETDSGDVLGHIIDKKPLPDTTITLDMIQNIVNTQFLGKIQQIPPIYSSLKIGGERASSLARQGKEVKMAAREVEIHSMEILGYDGEYLDFHVHCGKGTYIRSLALDLAKSIGTTCHLTQLTRTQVGLAEIGTDLPVLVDNYKELLQREDVFTGTDKIANIIMDNQRSFSTYIPIAATLFNEKHLQIAEKLIQRFNQYKLLPNGGFNPHHKFQTITIDDMVKDEHGELLLNNLIPPHFIVNYSQYYDVWDDDFNPSLVSGQTVPHQVFDGKKKENNNITNTNNNDSNNQVNDDENYINGGVTNNDNQDDDDDDMIPSPIKQQHAHVVTKSKPIKGLNPTGHKVINHKGFEIDYLGLDYTLPPPPVSKLDEKQSTDKNNKIQYDENGNEIPSKPIQHHLTTNTIPMKDKLILQANHNHTNYLEYHSPMRYLLDYNNGSIYKTIFNIVNTYLYDFHSYWYEFGRPEVHKNQATKELRYILQKIGLSRNHNENYLSFTTYSMLEREKNEINNTNENGQSNNIEQNQSQLTPTTSDPSHQCSLIHMYSPNMQYDKSHPFMILGNKYVFPLYRPIVAPYTYLKPVRIEPSNNQTMAPSMNDFIEVVEYGKRKYNHQNIENNINDNDKLYNTTMTNDKFSMKSLQKQQQLIRHKHATRTKIFQATHVNYDNGTIPEHELPQQRSDYDIITNVPHHLLPTVYPLTDNQKVAHSKYAERTYQLFKERIELSAPGEYLELWDSINRSRADVLDSKKLYLQNYSKRVAMTYFDARIIALQRYSNEHRIKSSPVINAPNESIKKYRLWSRLTRDIQGNLIDFTRDGRIISYYDMTPNPQVKLNRPQLKLNPKLNSRHNRTNYVNDQVVNLIDEYKFASLGSERYQKEQYNKERLEAKFNDQNDENNYDTINSMPDELFQDIHDEELLPLKNLTSDFRKHMPRTMHIDSPPPAATISTPRRIMTFHEKRMYIKRLKIEHSKLLRRLSLETTMLEQLTHHYLTQRQTIYHQRGLLMGELNQLQDQYKKLNQKVKKTTDIQSILFENSRLKEQIRSREEQLLLLTDRLQTMPQPSIHGNYNENDIDTNDGNGDIDDEMNNQNFNQMQQHNPFVSRFTNDIDLLQFSESDHPITQSMDNDFSSSSSEQNQYTKIPPQSQYFQSSDSNYNDKNQNKPVGTNQNNNVNNNTKQTSDPFNSSLNPPQPKLFFFNDEQTTTSAQPSTSTSSSTQNKYNSTNQRNNKSKNNSNYHTTSTPQPTKTAATHDSFYSHSAGPYQSKSFTFDESGDDEIIPDFSNTRNNNNNNNNNNGSYERKSNSTKGKASTGSKY